MAQDLQTPYTAAEEGCFKIINDETYDAYSNDFEAICLITTRVLEDRFEAG